MKIASDPTAMEGKLFVSHAVFYGRMPVEIIGNFGPEIAVRRNFDRRIETRSAIHRTSDKHFSLMRNPVLP